MTDKLLWDILEQLHEIRHLLENIEKMESMSNGIPIRLLEEDDDWKGSSSSRIECDEKG